MSIRRHVGPCCPSCLADEGTEWAADLDPDACCCYAIDLETGDLREWPE